MSLINSGFFGFRGNPEPQKPSSSSGRCRNVSGNSSSARLTRGAVRTFDQHLLRYREWLNCFFLHVAQCVGYMRCWRWLLGNETPVSLTRKGVVMYLWVLQGHSTQTANAFAGEGGFCRSTVGRPIRVDRKYRGTSLIRDCLLLGFCSRPMPRVVWCPWGGGVL